MTAYKITTKDKETLETQEQIIEARPLDIKIEEDQLYALSHLSCLDGKSINRLIYDALTMYLNDRFK